MFRQNAAYALSYSTTPESLINSISDKDTSVRERIRTSLTGLTGHSVDSGVDPLSPEKIQNACRIWWGETEKRCVLLSALNLFAP